MSAYQKDKLTELSLFIYHYVKFYHIDRYVQFIEDGNYKGEYALKNAIFDILKYLFIVEPYMTKDFVEQAHEKILDLYEDIQYEQSSIERLLSQNRDNEKLLRQYQIICAINLSFDELISSANACLESRLNQ